MNTADGPVCGCKWCEMECNGVHLHRILERYLNEKPMTELEYKQREESAYMQEEISSLRDSFEKLVDQNTALREALKAVL